MPGATPMISGLPYFYLRGAPPGAIVELWWADGKGDALVSARYGYPGLLLSMAPPDTSLRYWDYQARAGLNLDVPSVGVEGGF